MSSVDDDDEPQLSAHTLAALNDFLMEQKIEDQNLQEAQEGDLEHFTPQENWQLSQFWYDDKTATRLAEEAIVIAGQNGRIACISSPTVYSKIRQIKPSTCTAKCLEFDARFKCFGEDFLLYDYNQPLELPQDWKQSFDVILVDPPFLAEECLTKTAQSVKFLAKDKIILCTGSIMEELAGRLLGTHACQFRPMHKGLQNDFKCYINYDQSTLNKD
ncbi:EEF1A lysine methyltransferase 1-like isoform X2 [Gigantopelta aegis]|nr:EEF1A lysine methyltransferase 1-like isoform X2 [Gigantopelta aegis]XP_041351482.1 EEF1A lysine methyltransferase 1-like isoform X2 [Gigantopelta aegis]XP_041351483.1 EEF1A lysine methyltransferase 1-like isoform X2 [Gigantopelta aegis]